MIPKLIETWNAKIYHHKKIIYERHEVDFLMFHTFAAYYK